MALVHNDFHSSLVRLEDQAIRLGHRAMSLIPIATAGVLQGDRSSALLVLPQDDEIDVGAADIADDIHLMLTLNNPLAEDLRRVLALLQGTRSIERIGDYCVNIVRLAREHSPEAVEPSLHEQLLELAVRVERTVAEAIEGFGRRTPAGISAVDELENGVDQLRAGLVERLTRCAEDGGERARWAIPLIQTAGHLERISDHAVRLAHQGRWATTGRR